MTDTASKFEVYHCPSCGKPTTESLPSCRHCHAALAGSNAGQTSGRIFADEGPSAKWGCIGAVAMLIAVAGGGITLCSYQSADQSRKDAEQAAEDAKADKARYEERVRSGEVCSDGPNGLNTALQLNVQRGLKDPDSFDHIGTVIKPSDDGRNYDALMRYRARNSIGALVVGTAYGKLYLSEPNTCEVQSFKVLE